MMGTLQYMLVTISPGYENAVIESVYGGVIIRELSESEAINDPFTHYGYMKGIDYTN